MSDLHDNNSTAIAKRFYELALSGKPEQAAQLLAEDLVVDIPPQLPHGGLHHGPGGIGEALARVAAVADFQVLELITIGGDPIAFNLKVRFTSKATGKSVDMDLIELVSVRNDKISKLDVYYKDPEVVAAALLCDV